jgi:hypothetical protein
MSDQNNTPPHPERELKFQMQAMTQMMERMNFVIGNVCDRLDRVEKRGDEAGTSTQNVRNLGAEPKANNGSRAERLRWVVIMRILRRRLMILVMVVLRMRS